MCIYCGSFPRYHTMTVHLLRTSFFPRYELLSSFSGYSEFTPAHLGLCQTFPWEVDPILIPSYTHTHTHTHTYTPGAKCIWLQTQVLSLSCGWLKVTSANFALVDVLHSLERRLWVMWLCTSEYGWPHTWVHLVRSVHWPTEMWFKCLPGLDYMGYNFNWGSKKEKAWLVQIINR